MWFTSRCVDLVGAVKACVLLLLLFHWSTAGSLRVPTIPQRMQCSHVLVTLTNKKNSTQGKHFSSTFAP